jgi:glycosyltransferase involved in cell wall biosynthesis
MPTELAPADTSCPDISVIIPTFRRPTLLQEALASVFRQSGVRVEVFVVDDCPDGSAQPIVEATESPDVKYIRNPCPSGGRPSLVRNLAWPHASGKYVHFLDDDDIVPDGHYAAAIAAFLDHPQVGLVFGRIEPFGTCPPQQLRHEIAYFADAARNAQRCARFGRRFSFASWMLFGPAMLVCSAGIVRRQSVVGVGGFDPSIRLIEDTDFFCRVARRDGVHFLDRVTLHYRIGSPSLMHAPDPTPEQREAEREGVRRTWASYRRTYGDFEFFALAALARLFLKHV